MSLASNEAFDIISHKSSTAIYGEWEDHASAKLVDTDIQIHAYLREHYPELTITTIPAMILPLIRFANAGFATAELDTKTDSILRWRGFIPPTHRGEKRTLGDATFFAKYHYKWQQEDFILYTIGSASSQMQYILKEPGPDEDTLSNCAKSDALIKTALEVLTGNEDEFVYVYDNYWTRSKPLWEEVMRSSWDNVILDPRMKQGLQDISTTFFDSKDIYERYGVPWKRGLIFAGPPGNGKTISIKALMKTLYQRKPSIPTLYVRNAPGTGHLANVFNQARTMTPCLLVMEDIETIVTPNTRSYFFNQVDGLGNNGGILMVASTNYLERLDPGLSKRPSRFDRKFIFPLPDEHERALYAEFWRQKLIKAKSDVEFPKELCAEMAKITGGFSFAYLQEAFIASLLIMARDATDLAGGMQGLAVDDFDEYHQSRKTRNVHNEYDDGDGNDGDDDDFEQYKLWRVFKAEVKELRENMGSEEETAATSFDSDFSHQPPVHDDANTTLKKQQWRAKSRRLHGLPDPETRQLGNDDFDINQWKNAPGHATRAQRHNGQPFYKPPSILPTPASDTATASTLPLTTVEPEPDSLQLFNAGFSKGRYVAEHAYEWRHW